VGSHVLTIPEENRKTLIEELVDDYFSAAKSREPDSKSAGDLFSLLLDPVIGQRQTKLIVVPDGKLNILPFDALRNSEGKYLLESHVVTYAPSATVLYLLRNRRPSERTTRNFLGVGGVVYSIPVQDGNSSSAVELTQGQGALRSREFPTLRR
jgi:CHAT domain-containing protein